MTMFPHLTAEGMVRFIYRKSSAELQSRTTGKLEFYIDSDLYHVDSDPISIEPKIVTAKLSKGFYELTWAYSAKALNNTKPFFEILVFFKNREY